jgi:5,10-methylenetetrahydromethanopterin reductase
MRDPFVSLAALAIDTSHIPLMLAVTNPLTRDPSVMAGTVLALEDLAPGRVMLGFGSGDSATYGAGLGGSGVARIEEYITALRRSAPLRRRQPAGVPGLSADQQLMSLNLTR